MVNISICDVKIRLQCIHWVYMSILHSSLQLYALAALNIHIFYDRMTVHRNRFLVNKTNRCTKFQLYWYYCSTCFGQHFCPSSGVLRRTSTLEHFISFDEPFATRSRMELWWWAERLRETCRVVIPIKLEFSASVGFTDKEFISALQH